MKKCYFVILMALLIPLVSARICEDSIGKGLNCSVVRALEGCVGSPSEYNYTISNLSGVVQSGNYSAFFGGTYYFNFSVDVGDYVILSCDNSTKAISVVEGGEGGMVIGLIILLPLLLAFLFMLGVISMGDEHVILKLTLFLLVVPLFFVSNHYAMLSLVKFYDFPELQDMIGTSTYWIGIVFAAIIFYFLIYIFAQIVHIAAQKKKEKLEY